MNYDFISISLSECELQQKCLVSDQTCILMVMVAKVDISTTNLFCTLFKLHSKLLKTSIFNWFLCMFEVIHGLLNIYNSIYKSKNI